MIHLTKPERVDAILEQGLRTGLTPELTDDAIWTVDWYGTNPVFLGEPSAEMLVAMLENDPGLAIIDVDVSGLELVADLACLVDAGGRYDPDGYIYFTPSRIPEGMRPYLDRDGAIEIEHLLDPTTDACKAAIALTGTAACLEDIPRERVSLSEALAPGLSR